MNNSGYSAAQFAPSSYALILWDAAIQSYINCYLLLRPPHTILIDTGKAEHLSSLIGALGSLGLKPEDVTHIIATHGHRDHVGAAAGFPAAARFIHPQDVPLLETTNQAAFDPSLPENGKVLSLRCVLLGQHTPGSVALFDPQSKALFCGDHICFFGDPLPSDGPISYAAELRQTTCEFMRDWMHGPDRFDDTNLTLSLKGLEYMREFEADVLCTGHGAVLVGDINPFLMQIQEAVSS